jgi:hypothetical protein
MYDFYVIPIQISKEYARQKYVMEGVAISLETDIRKEVKNKRIGGE